MKLCLVFIVQKKKYFFLKMILIISNRKKMENFYRIEIKIKVLMDFIKMIKKILQ